eukprot:5082553-Pyramimonas_sp.AAC.2
MELLKGRCGRAAGGPLLAHMWAVQQGAEPGLMGEVIEAAPGPAERGQGAVGGEVDGAPPRGRRVRKGAAASS